MALDTKFKKILTYLEDPSQIGPTGNTNVIYLTFAPEEILDVKSKLSSWLLVAKGHDFDVETLSVSEVLLNFFRNTTRRKLWDIPEAAQNSEEVSTFFKRDLGSMVEHNSVLEKEILAAQEQMKSYKKPLLIVTDLEAIHPYTRFGPIEHKIYHDLKIPLLVLYPGTLTGSSLEFLGFYPPDGNYRSKHF